MVIFFVLCHFGITLFVFSLAAHQSHPATKYFVQDSKLIHNIYIPFVRVIVLSVKHTNTYMCRLL